MFKNLLGITVFIFSIIAIEQEKITSKYEFKYYAKINTHILEEYNGYLYFDDTKSFFYWEKIKDGLLKSTPDGNYTRAEHLKDGEFNFFKKNERQIISKAIVSKTEHHYVKQETPNFNWKILEESKVISGYLCHKATTNYMGRSYTAWFTKEIPVSFGPWKLNGLPGLILQAVDNRNEIAFSITEINKKDIVKKIDYIEKNLVSLSYYYQRIVDYPFEQLKITQSKMRRGGSISITNIKYNFIEKDFEVLGKKEFKN